MIKDHGLTTWSSAAPAVHDSLTDSTAKSAAELKVTEAEQRLNKHR